MNEKDVLRENIKNNLIKLRQKKGLTQADIADETNKAKTAVASWEQGKSLPDVTTLYHLSKFYNVSLEYFYEPHKETEAYIPTIVEWKGERDDMKEFVEVMIKGIVNEELDKREKKTKPFNKNAISPKLRKSTLNDKIITVDVNKLQPDFTLQVASADRPKSKTNSYKTVKVVGVRKARRKSEE